MNKTLLFVVLMFIGVAISFIAGTKTAPGAALAGVFAVFIAARVPWQNGNKSIIDSTKEDEKFVPAYLIPAALPFVFFCTGWLLKVIRV